MVCLMNGELEMTYKEAAMTCFAVLYQHSSGDNEKNSHLVLQGRRCPCRDP